MFEMVLEMWSISTMRMSSLRGTRLQSTRLQKSVFEDVPKIILSKFLKDLTRIYTSTLILPKQVLSILSSATPLPTQLIQQSHKAINFCTNEIVFQWPILEFIPSSTFPHLIVRATFLHHN